MKKKILLTLLAVFLCAGSSWTYKLIWGKPSNFNLFVERVLLKRVLSDPEFLTYLGLLDNTPFNFSNGRLTNISYDQNVATLEQTRDSLNTLQAYRRDRLNIQEKLTYDILERCLKSTLTDASFGYGSSLNTFSLSDFSPYPVNQVFGMQSVLPDFMLNIHRVVNEKTAKNYIERISQWKQKFSDLKAELALREKNGVVPPLFVIEKVLNELKQFVSVDADANLLLVSFQTKLEKLKLSDAKKGELAREALREIETRVYPAYKELIAFLERQKEIATQDAGVWKLPNGEKYYAECLKYHTTTNDTPDEVHALGLSEVKRIQAEMRQALDRLGYQQLGFIEAMKTLAADPQFFYPDTVDGREELLGDYRAIFGEIQNKMKLLFSQFPRGELKIEEVPDFRSKTAPVAYYEPGDIKGTRPGVFFVNTHNMKNQPKFSMHTLAYHEGVPGHHFQIALALEIENLPTLRKIVPFTAYQEGWALYCEQLAFENGFTASPYANLGRLQMELMRAVRLVVDTGIHWKRWTRERAIGYMMENTGMNESEVTIEIERYVVMPAQACSYKIGMIKILELREEMKQRLGASFDIKRFHQLVLENGAMPLSLLESYVRENY